LHCYFSIHWLTGFYFDCLCLPKPAWHSTTLRWEGSPCPPHTPAPKKSQNDTERGGKGSWDLSSALGQFTSLWGEHSSKDELFVLCGFSLLRV
jgi:hypothetical protein